MSYEIFEFSTREEDLEQLDIDEETLEDNVWGL